MLAKKAHLTANNAPMSKRDSLPSNSVIAAISLLWGLSIFLPVGTNYLALCLLLLGIFAERRYRERFWLMGSTGIFWPSLVFAGWTLVTLALQPETYPETWANLVHGLRIALTLLLAACLTKGEAISAIAGMLLSSALVLLWLGGYYAGLLPYTEFWSHLTHPTTNKSIGASILFSFAAVASFGMLAQPGLWSRITATLIFILSATIIILVLGKRTAMIGVLIGFLAIAAHLWRDNLRNLAAGLIAIFALTFSVYQAVPSLQNQINKGILEVQQALNGKVSMESWNVRIQMARHTTEMLLEKPALGWGIGSWNSQWRSRAPDIMRDFNMPHNDFLWMGSQAGVPGALAWLMLFLSICWKGWKTQTTAGRICFAFGLIALFSSLVNNGTRDAGLGLPMLWVLGVVLSLAQLTRNSYSESDHAPSL